MAIFLEMTIEWKLINHFSMILVSFFYLEDKVLLDESKYAIYLNIKVLFNEKSSVPLFFGTPSIRMEYIIM